MDWLETGWTGPQAGGLERTSWTRIATLPRLGSRVRIPSSAPKLQVRGGFGSATSVGSSKETLPTGTELQRLVRASPVWRLPAEQHGLHFGSAIGLSSRAEGRRQGSLRLRRTGGAAVNPQRGYGRPRGAFAGGDNFVHRSLVRATLSEPALAGGWRVEKRTHCRAVRTIVRCNLTE